ncbi:MAG: Hsp20 family protein [Candidatus Gastranaerophilales bacterium]|nr:Hsp20 family protein [Candidatus Gastranaerophilales bacterium]
MEENNTNRENEFRNNEKHICFENHCWKKCLAMICAAFLGGFLAFYFAADQMMHRYQAPAFNPEKFEKRMFDDIDRMYKEDMKAFEDSFNFSKKLKKKKFQNSMIPSFSWDTVKIKTEFEDNMFNIIIGLKPFQYDESKVNYNINGRKLTVFGSSEVKDKDYEHDVSFSQDFILPENADIMNITKEKEGHNLVISVPVKE